MIDQIIHYLTNPLVGAAAIALICLAMLFGVLGMARKLWNDIQAARAQQQNQAQVAGQAMPVPAPAPAPASAPNAGQQQTTETSSRMGWNMWIAKTHEFATQVIGVQIAGANVLAIIVSVVSVVGGLVSLAAKQYPGVFVLWFAAGAVGLGVAILIEGITISALIRIRNAGPAIRKAMAQWEQEFDAAKQRDAERYYSDKHYRRAMNRDFADRKKRLVKPHEKKRRDSVPFAMMGAVASATAGGLFYHTILQGLEMWLSFAISGLLAFVVTGTFVSQELFREDQEDAIKEGFKGGSLTLEAIKEEAKRISMQEIYASLRTYMQSDEARTTINSKLLQMLTKALDDITDSTVAQFKPIAVEVKAAQTPHPEEQPEAQQPEPKTEQQPAPRQEEAEPKTDEIPATPAPVPARARLGKIEGMMYDRVIADPQVLAELQQILATGGVPGLTAHLKKQYKAQALFITAERVSRVIAAIQQDQKAQASTVIAPETQDVIASENTPNHNDASPVKEAEDQAVIGQSQDERQSPEKERVTDAISIIEARNEEAGQDLASEYKEVVIAYPNIAQAWLARGVKSVSVEEIINVTGLSRQKVQYHAKHTLAKTPKNPERFQMASVLKWLATTVKQTGNTVEMQAVEAANHNGHHNGNGHSKTQELDAQAILDAQLEQVSAN